MRRCRGRFWGSSADGVGARTRKARIVEETLRTERPEGTVRFCCRLRSERWLHRPGPMRQGSRARGPSGRRTKSVGIKIELGPGSRMRVDVDNELDTDAVRRVLSVLSSLEIGRPGWPRARADVRAGSSGLRARPAPVRPSTWLGAKAGSQKGNPIVSGLKSASKSDGVVPPDPTSSRLTGHNMVTPATL